MNCGRLGRLVLVVLCAFGCVAGPAATAAQAHSGVRSIEPADGSTLTTAPEAVRLTYTEDVLEGTAQLRVTGPSGQVASTVTTAGPTVSGSLPADLPNGAYTVLWRVTSADGHPISGSFRFTLDVAAAAPSSPPSSAAPSSAPSSAPSPAAPSTSPMAAHPDPLDPASTTAGASSGTKLVIGLGAVLAGLAAVGGLWARGRRTRP